MFRVSSRLVPASFGTKCLYFIVVGRDGRHAALVPEPPSAIVEISCRDRREDNDRHSKVSHWSRLSGVREEKKKGEIPAPHTPLRTAAFTYVLFLFLR